MDFLQDYNEDYDEPQEVVDEVQKKVKEIEKTGPIKADDGSDEDLGPLPFDLNDENEEEKGNEKGNADEESSDDEFGPKPLPFDLGSTKEGDKDMKKKKKKVKSERKMHSEVNPSTKISHDEDALESFARQKKIPIASEVHLIGHQKACTCISIEPAGNRLVTGSLDYFIKIYDFGGMDSRCKPFQSKEPDEGHPIVAICHSPSGDRFILSTGSSQPIVLDRDGNELIKFVKGDMYLRDLSHTKGHTMEVTHVKWHPFEKNIVVTSSLDGTLRIWDLLGEAAFGCLINKHVLKVKAQTGLSRIAATTCTYSPNGQKIIAGVADGTIQIWNEKRIFNSKPDHILRLSEVHESSSPVTSLIVSHDNLKLFARYENGIIAAWSLQQQQQDMKKPLWILHDMLNMYPSANLLLNGDSSLLIFCTSPTSTEPHSRIRFLELPTTTSSSSSSSSSSFPPKEVLSLVISNSLIGIQCKWHPLTNQLFITLSNGEIKVLYDAELSKKGILLAIHKAPKREKDPNDYSVVGEIYTPFAEGIYKQDTDRDKYIKRVMDLKDPIISKIPQKPNVTQGPGSKPNTSFFFTQYVLNTSGKQRDIRTEDPREALLKMNEKAENDPKFFGNAYSTSQPKRILSTTTFEEEQEEFKKKQKILHP